MIEQHEPSFRLRTPTLVLWRAPGVLQLGIDAEAVILRDVPELLAEAVTLLHSAMTARELAARLPGLEPGWTRWLCAHLSSVGLLSIESTAPTTSVAVWGESILAEGISRALSRVAVPNRRLPPSALADSSDPHCLVVVAAPTAEPDRVAVNRLQTARRSHLVVRLYPAQAVVGPLVSAAAPGCLHCEDLDSARSDPAWATLLSQLCRLQVTPDPGLLAWAVATTVNQVRAWRSGAAAELHNRCLAVASSDFRQHSRDWPAHPDCPCSRTSDQYCSSGLPASLSQRHRPHWAGEH